jgi:hypothetical protein
MMEWEFELVAGPYGGTTEGPACRLPTRCAGIGGRKGQAESNREPQPFPTSNQAPCRGSWPRSRIDVTRRKAAFIP